MAAIARPSTSRPSDGCLTENVSARMAPLGDKHERPNRPDGHRPEEADKHASPLGRGANPGPSVDAGPLRASEGGGIATPHGHNVPNAAGGPSGFLTRENEDSVPEARRDARDPGH